MSKVFRPELIGSSTCRTLASWCLDYFQTYRFRSSAETVRVSFIGYELKVLSGPIVYLAKRSRKFIYVGRSSQGLARPFSSKHHVLGREQVDELVVYPCASPGDAAAMEAALIERLRPPLNKRIVRRIEASR